LYFDDGCYSDYSSENGFGRDPIELSQKCHSDKLSEPVYLIPKMILHEQQDKVDAVSVARSSLSEMHSYLSCGKALSNQSYVSGAFDYYPSERVNTLANCMHVHKLSKPTINLFTELTVYNHAFEHPTLGMVSALAIDSIPPIASFKASIAPEGQVYLVIVKVEGKAINTTDFSNGWVFLSYAEAETARAKLVQLYDRSLSVNLSVSARSN